MNEMMESKGRNIALIIAGGKGMRMHQEVPKQFLNVNNKPVIVYTLEAFQKHPQIDEIGVVCIEGWHEMLYAYARQYDIDKLKWIVPGGENGQGSIRNGVQEAEKRYDPEDIILVHDAIRPMVSQEIISDCIVTCQKYGSAISAVPCNTVVLHIDGEETSKSVVNRDELMLTQTPQAFPLKTIAKLHKDALERGITSAVASCSLMVDMGYEVHFSIGDETNLKLTTVSDMRLFEALLKSNIGGSLR